MGNESRFCKIKIHDLCMYNSTVVRHNNRATTHLSNHNSTLRMLNLVFEPSNNRSVSQSCISVTSLLQHTVVNPTICRVCLLGLPQCYKSTILIR